MRRIVGLALVLLGAFALCFAVLSRTMVSEQLLVTPLNQFSEVVSSGSGTYLDTSTFREASSDLVAKRTVRGDVKGSPDNEDVNVWDVSVVLETGDGTFVRAYVDRVAADRRTGESVSCCNENVDGTAVKHTGLSYKFPIGVEKQEYLLWDPNSRKSFPAKFIAEDDVKGLKTYKFIQQIPGQELRRQAVPGRLLGDSAPTVDAQVWYQNTRTIWVEPGTGVIVKGNEQNRTTLRDATGADKLSIISFDLTFNDATQSRQVDLAEENLAKVRLLSQWLPLGSLILGLLALGAGLLMLRGERARPAAPAERDPAPEKVS